MKRISDAIVQHGTSDGRYKDLVLGEDLPHPDVRGAESEVRSKLLKASQDRQNLTKLREVLESKLKDADGRMVKLGNHLEAVQEQNGTLQVEKTRLKEDNTKLRKENETLIKDTAKLTREKEALQRTFDELKLRVKATIKEEGDKNVITRRITPDYVNVIGDLLDNMAGQ